MTQLSLIIFGLAANVFFAMRTKQEPIAVTHFTASILLLIFAPTSLSIYIAAVVVTLFALARTYMNLWHLNLYKVIASFAIFHYFWHWDYSVSVALYQMLGIGGFEAESFQWLRYFGREGLAAHLEDASATGLLMNSGAALAQPGKLLAFHEFLKDGWDATARQVALAGVGLIAVLTLYYFQYAQTRQKAEH